MIRARIPRILDAAGGGQPIGDDAARLLTQVRDHRMLSKVAAELRDAGHGEIITYSPKVFIPLTRLCRDACRYCTFARPPENGRRAYLTLDEVRAIARRGVAAGCREALFTLGDRPELRYRTAREELEHLGHETTLSYLAEAARVVLEDTGLLPHANPGVMSVSDIALLRVTSVSQGIMLESASRRLCERGGPHHGCPDKDPEVRLDTIRWAGQVAVPFTTGILIGIGETRSERIESLLELRRLHRRYGHVQEIIVQNFRAKIGTPMSKAAEPSLEDHLWTIAVARILFGPTMNIQAPPNLRPEGLIQIIEAGANDWGGVSPVTPDYVNPEAPWPHLEELARQTGLAGKQLVPRLAVYPTFAHNPQRWLDPALRPHVLRHSDAEGFARDTSWSPGLSVAPPPLREDRPSPEARIVVGGRLVRILDQCFAGKTLSEMEIVHLFQARGRAFTDVCSAADKLRAEVNGDVVTYVVNRNINYTNVCYFRCQFCAFSKGKLSENLRGRPYDLDLDEIQRRVGEADSRGATEVCLQGGIHPQYTGATYLDICRAVKTASPEMHVHAFSPLEIWQGAATLGVPVAEFLAELREAGLGSLPGTAAEILDDEVRAVLCPDKITTSQWLEVVEAAHETGLPTTATIMFGHVDRPRHWARHLLRLRDVQARTGGFTEFVPLPFVHMEAPIFLKGRARMGPTFREALLVHAVSRLALHPLIENIQVSWVKMGPLSVAACLQAGVNDLGGTLMNESISRAAGTAHGEEMPPERMESIIRNLGRRSSQRTTLYGEPPPQQIAASFNAPPLTRPINTPARGNSRPDREKMLVRSGFA